MDHLRIFNTHPASGEKTEFVLWHDSNAEQQYSDYTGRCVFNINTGVASLHLHLTAAECRELAKHLRMMAEAIETDMTTFQPKEGSAS
jgi:hypothetical protein